MADSLPATARRPGAAIDPRGASEPSRPVAARLLAAMLSLLSGACGLALALKYPIGPPLAAAAVFAAVAVWAVLRPGGWILALPAVLALVGFAPWTGWLTFEELDMLVLAIAAGGHARRALERFGPTHAEAPVAMATRLLVVLFALSILIALARGVADAGGFEFGWFQGYEGPMNSVRLAKSFFFALLLFPLWRDAHDADPVKASRRWSTGLCLGLAGASLAALWERLAFTRLLDFSTDYRTTALFWEMHVGGAALDGFLALTVPFAVRELLTRARGWRWIGALAILVVASYACMTTFSRGVFLAIPVSVATMGWLALRQRTASSTAGPSARGWMAWAAVFAAAYAAAAWWLFPVAGYRGMLALLGAFALLMRLGADALAVDPLPAGRTLALAVALGGVAFLVAWGLPRGAYVAYTLAFAFTAAAAWRARTRWMAFAGFAAVVFALGLVCGHWGGERAFGRALPVMAVLLFAALALGGARPGRQDGAWPASPRWQAAVLACMVAISGGIGVMIGGAYMTDRMSTTEGDLQTRVEHWREGLSVLHSPAQWALGIGLGRYPATYALLHEDTDAPGGYALRGAPGEVVLALSAGRHMLGWGEMLRVSQRVGVPRLPVQAELQVRAAQQSGLHLELCEKHLLYNGACLLKELEVPATGTAWRTIRTPLDGLGVSRGQPFAPRMLSFSISNRTQATLLEVREVRLIDGSGTDLLVNGDFSHGMAHWFFSSDRNHLPWHLKNVFVHVLFDQGLFGLGVFVLMLLGGLWRLALGSARAHPLAPAIAGPLAGFVVVGLFDSLVDVPRDAFVFYFLLLQALTLHGLRRT
jgi:hypothetical protein